MNGSKFLGGRPLYRFAYRTCVGCLNFGPGYGTASQATALHGSSGNLKFETGSGGLSSVMVCIGLASLPHARPVSSGHLAAATPREIRVHRQPGPVMGMGQLQLNSGPGRTHFQLPSMVWPADRLGAGGAGVEDVGCVQQSVHHGHAGFRAA